MARTHLCSGPRVAKDDPHIEACGAVDELNALLGLVRAESLPADIDSLLHRVQHELFSVGADLAMPGLAGGPFRFAARRAHGAIGTGDRPVRRGTAAFDRVHFAGGQPPAALLHCARTVCRRAERRVVSLLGSDRRVRRRVHRLSGT